MRALKIATILMGILIVVGTMGLIIGLARRASGPPATSTGTSPPDIAPLPAAVAAILDEPVGTRIAGLVAVRDRLALRLEGGGVDRIVLIDPSTGAVAGRIALAR